MCELKVKVFDSENFCGYKQITTFFQDFSIADIFGVDAIRDTYKRGLEYAKTDYKILTEFVMVLNWKSWQHADGIKAESELCKLYCELYYKARNYAITHLKGAEFEYFYDTTD